MGIQTISVSVANFWQMISAKYNEKFGRWQKRSAAYTIFA
jgi:hypothetical protein